jgi:hypothetical protein
LIVLDEPFTGLDSEAAASVAKELNRLRSEHGTALLLISHEPDIVALLMGASGAVPTISSSSSSNNNNKSDDSGDDDTNGGGGGGGDSDGGNNASNKKNSKKKTSKKHLADTRASGGGDGNGGTRIGGGGGGNWFRNEVVVLRAANSSSSSSSPFSSSSLPWSPRRFFGLLFGTSAMQRFWSKLGDYLAWSLPLVLLAFGACGLAIAMLSADMLQRINVTEPVLGVIEKQVC